MKSMIRKRQLDYITVCLNQKLLAELYGVTVPTINEHIINIYDDEELTPESTIRKFRIVQTEGSRQVKRLVDHYNLDKFLADVELPVLESAGTVSRDTALEFANEQYDRFAEKRIIKAQQQADQNYIDDLKHSAEILKHERGNGEKQ